MEGEGADESSEHDGGKSIGWFKKVTNVERECGNAIFSSMANV